MRGDRTRAPGRNEEECGAEEREGGRCRRRRRRRSASGANHALCLNTLKGHQDNITGLAIGVESDQLMLATSSEDQAVRIFKLGKDMAAKSFHIIRINLVRRPPACPPRWLSPRSRTRRGL